MWYGTALSSEQQKDISGGNKAKVARALVLSMCVGDKIKEAGKSKASERGRLGIDKAGITVSPKSFHSFSSHKQRKRHPTVRNVLPAGKESVKLANPIMEGQTKCLFSAIGSIGMHLQLTRSRVCKAVNSSIYI